MHYPPIQSVHPCSPALGRLTGIAPSDLLLITDFDGTLAPIVPIPVHARPIPGALSALRRLAGHLGQVVVLTGRSRASLLAGLGGQVLPGVRILCNYGADDPDRPVSSDLAHITSLLREITHLHDRLPEGVMIEEKGASVALHTRGCDEPIAALAEIISVVTPVAHQLGLALQQGRDVIDIGIHHGGKANAVRQILGERDWGGAIMFGDDHSDLDAFDVLDASPIPTTTVGVRSDEVPDVAARSDVVVDSPEAVTAILLALADQLSVAGLDAPQ